MIFLLPALISFAVGATIALSSDFSALAYLISVVLVLVTFFAIKKDASSPKTSYGSVFMLILISSFLDLFIKTKAPLPTNLVYLLALISLAYCLWRVWEDNKRE